MLQTWLIYWMRVISKACIQTCVGRNKTNRFHSSDPFLWKSIDTRILALASNSSLSCGAREGLWESKAVSNQSNISKFQSQEKNAHFHRVRQTIYYKAVTGRVLMLPSIQIPCPIPVNVFQIHLKGFPKRQPTFHTPTGGQPDQHLIIKWCTHIQWLLGSSLIPAPCHWHQQAVPGINLVHSVQIPQPGEIHTAKATEWLWKAAVVGSWGLHRLGRWHLPNDTWQEA